MKNLANRKHVIMSFPSSMSVIEMREPGGPDVLEPSTRPIPGVKNHEILVKVSLFIFHPLQIS